MRLARTNTTRTDRGGVAVEWFVVLVFTCVVLLLTTPALKDADEAALRVKCK